MSASRTKIVWLSVLALGIAATPALAASTKAKHGSHATEAKAAPKSTTADDLNAQSLAAAKQGQNYMPPK